jgi:hypothetical protein
MLLTMVDDFGARRRGSPARKAIALGAILLLSALSVAIPVMDRDLAITDPAVAGPDSHERYYHDHQNICVPMEASQQLASGAVAGALHLLPVLVTPPSRITRALHASHQDVPRSRSPPPA